MTDTSTGIAEERAEERAYDEEAGRDLSRHPEQLPMLPGEVRPHPKPRQYVIIAVILVVLTGVEVGASYLEGSVNSNLLIAVLLVLAAITAVLGGLVLTPGLAPALRGAGASAASDLASGAVLDSGLATVAASGGAGSALARVGQRGAQGDEAPSWPASPAPLAVLLGAVLVLWAVRPAVDARQGRRTDAPRGRAPPRTGPALA